MYICVVKSNRRKLFILLYSSWIYDCTSGDVHISEQAAYYVQPVPTTNRLWVEVRFLNFSFLCPYLVLSGTACSNMRVIVINNWDFGIYHFDKSWITTKGESLQLLKQLVEYCLNFMCKLHAALSRRSFFHFARPWLLHGQIHVLPYIIWTVFIDYRRPLYDTEIWQHWLPGSFQF